MVHRVEHPAGASGGVLTEAHVQRLWHLRALGADRLLTEDGRRVEILFPGLPGVEGGPDFRAARLRIGGEPVIGDVEVHLSPSHWMAHGHQSRGAYAGVVEHSVYVAPGARGRGVGGALLQALIGSTEAAGIWTIQAGIFPENTASLRLHEREGFRVVGIRERIGHRDGRWRDVVLVERRSTIAGLAESGPA